MNRVAIGQDSHSFVEEWDEKKLMLGGVYIPGCPGLSGNSDADVILHAITNAVSGITCVNVLGVIADELCLKEGITDSVVYLKKALSYLKDQKVVHVSISIEALRPKLLPHIDKMRESISELLSIEKNSVGITATTGEGLTEFGKGRGIFCTAIITVRGNILN